MKTIEKDIINLNIPVDDMFLFTGGQCLTHIHSQPENLLSCHAMIFQKCSQILQKLHTDIDIPANLFVSWNNLIILNHYNIAC